LEKRKPVNINRVGRKFKHGWSPQHMLQVYQLNFLLALLPKRRVVYPSMTLQQYCKQDILVKAIAAYDLAARDLSNRYPTELLPKPTKEVAHPPEWWQINFDSATFAMLQEEVASRKRNMHSRSRARQREDIDAYVQAREAKVEEGHLTSAFASLLEKPQIGWDPSELSIERNGEEVTLTDPKEIHDEVSKIQTGVFAASNSLMRRCGLDQANLGSLDDWEEMIAHPARLFPRLLQFLPALAVAVGSSFNLLHLQAIADAFKQRPGAQAVERMLRDLDSVPPSFEDFERALKGCSSTSSPGPTGLSYSLIKAFPLSAKKRLYELLCILWADKTIPGFWKSKFLVMLAKEPGGTPTPDKLRPLGLMETTRKLWTVMILSKIKHAILKCKVLQPNHYGFLPNRGTDSELVQILNILEEAIEHQEGIDLITWDIKKAFDSVSQNIQYLAWRRLGVPRPISAWLVALDNRGTFTVRSPYALNRIANVWNSPSAFADTQRILKEDGFEAEQGLTQGDVKSTLGWVAVFDILLTAMNDLAEQEHLQQVYLRHAGSFLYNSLALAFADDLVTIYTRDQSPIGTVC
jgi:hypothetical protein